MASDKQSLEAAFNIGAEQGLEQKKQDQATISLKDVWAVFADKFAADPSFSVNVFPGSVVITSRNCDKTLTVSDNDNRALRTDIVYGDKKDTFPSETPEGAAVVLGRYYARYGSKSL